MWYSAVGGIVTLILSLLTVPLTSQAQPAAKVPRLGLLIPSAVSAVASRLEAFRHGLRDLGYVEGHNIILEYRCNFTNEVAVLFTLYVALVYAHLGGAWETLRRHLCRK